MNKLIVPKDFITNFSVAKVKDYEGCPDALRMLTLRYGNETDDLSKRKVDFVKIVMEDNKPDWILNFLLNMIQETYRISFYEDYLKDCLSSVEDKKVSQNCQKGFQAVKNNKTISYSKYQLALEELIAKKESELQEPMFEKDSYQIHYQIFLCKSILNLLDDANRTLTRSVNNALQRIAEAQSVIDLDNARNNMKLKSIAMRLIDYSGMFEHEAT